VANKCVFCGDDANRLTDEHVFGDWISKFFIDELGVQLDGMSEIVDVKGNVKRYPQVPFQQKVKIVCKKCNEGWMSRLESSVISDLKVMMSGKPKMLRHNLKRRLAFWCAKTALVLDHMHPQNMIVPESHFRELYEQQSALRSQVVLVAFRSVTKEQPGELLASALKQPVTNVQVPISSPALTQSIQQNVAEGHAMYKITFAIGNFVALVFGHDFPMPLHLNSPHPIARHIWPINQRFLWSSELSIDSIGGLPAFHAAFAPNPDEKIPVNAPGQIKT